MATNARQSNHAPHLPCLPVLSPLPLRPHQPLERRLPRGRRTHERRHYCLLAHRAQSSYLGAMRSATRMGFLVRVRPGIHRVVRRIDGAATPRLERKRRRTCRNRDRTGCWQARRVHGTGQDRRGCGMKTLTCPICGKVVVPYNDWQQTCGSQECQAIWHKKTRYTTQIAARPCAICGEIFHPVRRDQMACRKPECRRAWAEAVRLERLARQADERQRRYEAGRRRWISRKRNERLLADISAC